jgi:leucyl aminopeptidase
MIRSVVIKPYRISSEEDAVVVPLCRGGDGRAADPALDRATREAIAAEFDKRAFSGSLGETLLLPAPSRRSAPLLLVGLGERAGVGAETVAIAAGAAARALDARRVRSAGVLVRPRVAGEDPSRFIGAFVKGFALGLYRYELRQKPARASSLRRLAVRTEAARARAATAVARARVVSEHASFVRDLVNAPGNRLTPARMAAQAGVLCKAHGVACRVMGRREMEREGMGAILGVARGSVEAPRLLVMEYGKRHAKAPQVCLVGKGVTFDSGGISLKPWEKMNEMKGDMAGGATVIAALAAAARLGLPLRVLGLVPCVENMPDAAALKPGDVITTCAGKTVEIVTTDAEGRLILADAVAFARRRFAPDVIVDFATLTGAVLVALGTRIAGVFGNSQPHVDRLLEAGREVGEPAWQLPLDEHFNKSVEGDIADFKNYSGRNGSSITAAALIGKFAEDTPWIHVDIAGTFWSDSAAPPHNVRGATGYGVDLALRFLERTAGA